MSHVIETTELTDDELAGRIALRDISASHWTAAQRDFEQLYQRHARKLLAFLASRVRRSDLDDVHQAVWTRIWKALPERFHGGTFRAWLYQIARNYLIDLSRKKQTELLERDGPLADGRTVRPDEALLAQERANVFRACLERLKSELADIVRARLGGDSYHEICSRMNLKPEQAHRLFFQAKDQLTACVQRVLK